MIFHVREQTLNLPDMPLDYIVFGSGKKNLIMIQGLGTRGMKGTGVFLAYMYRAFAKEYTVYLFDRRPHISDNLTVRDMAGDIARAMDALSLSGADVFGVSQGGMIAQYLAIDRPDLVNKLVLAVTLSRNNDTVCEVLHRWIQYTEEKRFKELVQDMAEKMYSGTYAKRYKPFIPILTMLQKPKDITRFIRLTKACLTCEAYEELEKIQCPVFVIGGKEDKIVTGKASEEIAEKLRCPIYMYENLGHAAYEEAKDFNARVLTFLRS